MPTCLGEKPKPDYCLLCSKQTVHVSKVTRFSYCSSEGSFLNKSHWLMGIQNRQSTYWSRLVWTMLTCDMSEINLWDSVRHMTANKIHCFWQVSIQRRYRISSTNTECELEWKRLNWISLSNEISDELTLQGPENVMTILMQVCLSIDGKLKDKWTTANGRQRCHSSFSFPSPSLSVCTLETAFIESMHLGT